MLYRPFALFLLLACAPFGGCDLFNEEEDTTIRTTGTVVLDQTGAPIEGLGVSIVAVPPSFGGSTAVATARTGARGQFDLSYDVPQPSGASVEYSYMVLINSEPYDAQYSTSGRAMAPGQTHDFGVVELSLNDGD